MEREIIFRQDPRLGTEVFSLRKGILTISNPGISDFRDKTFPLSHVDPKCVVGQKQFPILYIVPGILGLACLYAALELLKGNETSVIMSLIPLLCFATCVYNFVLGLKPIEITQFFDHRGDLLFTISEPRNSRHIYTSNDYQDFITAVRDGAGKSIGE